MTLQIADVLRKHRSYITDKWAQTLRSWEDTGYSLRSLEELRGTTGRCFDGYLDFMEAGNTDTIDSFIRDIVRRRASLGFRLGDVLRAFRAFLPIALEMLDQEGETGQQWTVFEPVEYALAICSAQYHQVVESELLKAVQELASALAGKAGDLQANADAVVQTAVRLTSSEYGYLDHVELRGERLTCSLVGVKPDECAQGAGEAFHMLGKGVFKEVTTLKRPFLTNRPAWDPARPGFPSDHPPIRSFLGVPILSGDSVVGFIALANKPGGYAEEDRGILSTIADVAAPALQAARLTQEFRLSQRSPKRGPGKNRA